MPTIVQTVNGIVIGLWGSALRRTPAGKLVPLQMGDIVHKGDVILTTQDGLVQLSDQPPATASTAAKAPNTPDAATTDMDRVIAELNDPDAQTAPAAGLNPGDGSGLQPGLRVGRIAEDVTPVTLAQTTGVEQTPAVPTFTTASAGDEAAAAAAPPNARPTADSANASGNEDATLPISLVGTDTDGSVAAVTVVSIPAGSTLLLADGVTPVTAGQTLTPAQAAGLLFRPAPDFNGGVAVTFTVTDDQGLVSAPATVQVTVLPVNDTPLTNAGIASVGPEYSSIPVNLGGSDIDGNVTAITITSPPVGGSLFLADGVTPVVPGTPLTPAQATGLVFVPNPGFTGSSPIGFTVTDNDGASSSAGIAQVNVTPVPSTLTLTSSAPSVAEGGSVVYTATVDHPVSGSALVVTLSNGAMITIPVGQSSASSAPVVPRADDADVQGTQTQTIAVASTSGGSYSSLVTTATVDTSVSDDTDITTASIGASAASVTEGGSIVYTVSLSAPVTGSPLVVTLSNGQTITLPVGQSSGTSAPFDVRADDVQLQGTDTIAVTITGTTGGNFEALTTSGTATTTVGDDADASTVTLTASAATVAEGGSIVYTATTSSPVAGSPLVLTLANGQTITIPVGASSASSAPFAVRPDDAQVQGTDTVTNSITGASGGNFEALISTGSPSTTVTDDADGSSITLTASAASVAEGGSITYTATVSAPVTGSPLVVTLSNGQTVTIPVGQSSASATPFNVRVDDALVQGTDTLAVTITGTTGGAYESLAITGGAASTSVTDDADATTVSLTASSATVTEGGSVVYTATLSNAVAGTPFVVTLSNGQTITIPVGQSSGSSAPFAVRADDAQVQGIDTLSVSVATTAGGNFEAVTATGTVSTTVTDDADPTTVTVSASAANVTEGGSIVYTVALSNAVTGSPLTITLSNGQSVTIPVGQSSASTAAFNVRADDVQSQPGDTLNVTVTGSTGGNFEALTPTGSAVTIVSDDADVSTVTLSASAASVAEGGSVLYTASVSAPVVGSPLVITLTNGQTITIPVGQSTADSAPFAVRADDNFVQGAQSFSVGIAGTSGGSYEALATTSTVSTTVTDDADVATVTLSATPSVAEGGTIVYTATLSSAAQTPVTVTLANGSVINIAAGSSSGTVNVAAPTDDAYLDAGSVSQTIATAGGGNFESLQVDPAAASTTVTDTLDATTVSLTGDPTLAESGSASYTVSLTSPAQTDVTVTLTYGGTAANGSDFTGTTTVTIPAGSSSASFSITALDDAIAEGPESFTVAIAGATGGNFESLVVSGANGAVTTGIVDNDISTVSLTASPSITEAGGTITYTATLTQAPTTALDVTLSNGAVVHVAAGALSGTVDVAVAASEDVYLDAASISATIASTSGGGIPLAVDPAPAVTAVTDTIDTTTVSLTANNWVVEGGQITYVASLDAPAGTDVAVTLSNGAQIVIAAGTSSNSVAVAAPDNDVHVDAADVVVFIASASGGNFENLAVSTIPAITWVADSLDTATVSLTADNWVVEGGQITYVANLDAPAGTDVTVTLTNGAQIVIAAGTSSNSVTVASPGNDVHVDAADVVVSIASASGGNFENLAVSTIPAITWVVDSLDTTTVSLTASPSVAEGGNIVYTASLTAPAQTDVTVQLSNGATITILANTSSGSIPFAAPTDDVYLDAGSVSVTIDSASGGNFESLAINPAAALTTITDTADASTVTLTASPAVAEGGNIVYTATLSAPAQTDMTVTLSNNAVITIVAGASVGTVAVAAPIDDVYTDTSNVSATIATASGGNFESLTVNPAAATTVITDTVDTSTVSLTATPAVAEGGSIVYTVSLTALAQGPVTVTLQSGTQITIPDGASSASITVAAPSEDVYVDAGNVSDRIVSAAGGNFENLVVDATPAVTAVSDTIATTTVSLTATASVAEGGNIVYTASLTAPAQAAVTVTLSDNSTITIPSGASSASITRPAPADDVFVDAGSVSLNITAATGGNFESLAVNATPAVTTVSDTLDTTTVSLTGTPAVAEGGSIVYTASLTAPAQTAVTVTLSNNATITIAAGASSASITLPAPTDDVYTDAGSVSVRIDSASGGNFETLAIDATPVLTSVSDTVDTSTVSLTATPAVAEGGSIVYTASLTAPAQGNVTVTLQSGATITILSGASTGSVSVPAPTDDVIVDAGTVSDRITGAIGGNFESLAVDATPAVTTASDTLDTTTVSLSGSGSVIEGNAGSYTVSLTSVAQAAVTVTLAYTGTAADGSDFTGITTVTIPAGSSSANFSIAALDDAAAEGSESFSVAIATATGGNFENLVVSGTNGSLSTGIVDNDVSVVSLSATPALTEAGGSIVYTASLTQAPVSDLTVTLSNGSTITVTAGSLTGTVSVPVAADEDVYVDPASISATITGTSGGGIALSIDPTPATTAVNDTVDTTTVSLSATPTVAEGGSIVYTATLTNAAHSPVTVNLSNGQQISIASGATTGTLTLAAPTDDALVDAGTVSLSITSASGGNFESLVRDPAPAVTTVTDTVDTTTVTLTASPTVAEGGNIVYTASLNNAAGTPVTVTLSNGAQIVIAAGTSSNSVSFAAPGEDVYTDAGNVSATIATATGGNFESLTVNPAAAITAVTDTIDTTTVTLTATPSVAEGGNIVYTASLTSAAASPVTVTLSNGQQIVIPTNAASSTITLPAPGDDAVADAGSVSLTIDTATGGGFESLVVNPAAATTTVTDTTDTTTVSLTATTSVAEGGSIVYTASLTSLAGTDVTVTLSNNEVITIPAGSASASVSVAAPGEDVLLDASTVSASIATATGGNFEQLVVDNTPAVTAVADTIDTTTVTLTATPTVAEGGNIVYTASLNNPAGTAVTVTLASGAQIQILAGNSSGTVTVPAPGNDAVLDAGPVSMTIATATGGNFESLAINPAPAITSVTDTVDTTTLTLSATPTIAEGGSIVYTASLTSPAGTDLTVTLSNNRTITIPAGASSASISVAAPTDDALIDAGTVSATITGTSGGNFESLVVDNTAASTSITDTIDTTTVTLTATPSVAEGGNIVYTASLDNAAGTDVTVRLSNGAQITILAGASSGTVTVAAPGEDALVDAGPVSATIDTATGGNFESLAINPAAATTAVTDTLTTTTVTLTATPSVAEGGSIVYTASLTAAAGTPLTVTLSNGEQIHIAAGASSGTVAVLAPTEDVYVDAGSVSASIDTVSGGNFENLVVDTTPAATTVTDTLTTTTVSLSGSGSVAEGASGNYTVSLTSPAQGTDVTVTLSYSGTAANGSDFTGVATVTIPAGSSSASFSLATLDDAAAEGAESFTVSINTATGGNFESLVVSGSAGAVTTGIVDNDISTLTLSATPTLTEAGGTLVYTATLTQAPVSDLTVTLSNGSTITVTAGSLTGNVSVPFTAQEDVYTDPTSVSATITGTSGGGIALSVNPAPAITSIVDTIDATTLTIGGPASLTEGTSGTYTLTLTNAAQTDVTVTLAYSGTASAADRSGTTTVTIPAGATSATFSVAALDDAFADAGETVVVTITGATGGTFENLVVGGANSVTTTLSDEATPDTVLVSLAGPGTVTEGVSTANYTVTLGQAAVTPVTVNLNYSGTAVDGSDYTRALSVTIPAGATSATFNLATLDDVIADSGDTIVVSLGGISGGGFEAIAADGAANSVTTVINDEATADVTTVSLAATPTIAEGGSIVYTATLTSAAQTPVTVQLSNGQQIVIGAGSTSASLTVAAPGEDVYVDAGNVSVNITGASGGGFESLVHDATPAVTSVTDTLDTTTVSLTGSGSVNEGASGTYTLSLTSPAQGTGVTVTLRYSGTAADGTDFTGVTTVTIPANSSTASFSIATLDDNLAEGAESFIVTIDGASGGNFESLVISGSNASVTTGIVDNDVSAIASVSAANAVETVSIVHTVTLSNPSTTATTYSLSLNDGTATGGTDYTATLTNASFSNGVTISGGTITVPAGVTSFTVTVPTLGDSIDEADETYTLSVGGVTALGTVLDDDAAPTISTVSAATQTEGTSLVHTVTLSNASSSATTFAYSLGGGSATGGGVDYSDASFSNGVTLSGGVLTVPAGVTSFTVTVPTTFDTIDEGTAEDYTLSVGGVAATGTITDDDSAPAVLSVGAATQVEGTALVHTVTLGNASSTATTFAYSLGGGSATGGGVDYSSATFSNGVTLSGGVLTVPAGVTSFTVTVPTTLDTIDEGASETYNLSVGGVAAIGTITDDDNAPTISSVSAATQVEGVSLVHTVTLSNASSIATTYAYSLGGGTATGGGVDYSSATFSNGVTLSGGVLTVPAGVTSFTVTVPTTLDTIDEGASETYNISVGGVAALGTITDDDNAPIISTVSAATQTEGTSLVHTVTLSNASSSATTFAYSLGGGTATGGGVDYSDATFSNGVTLSGGVLTVPAGVTSFTVTVPSTLDTIDEGASETYNLSVGGVAAIGTITDDDAAPTISSVSSATAVESVSLVHTVTLSNASSSATTFAYSLGGGTATGGGVDYSDATFSNGVTLAGGVLTVPAGVTSFTITVPTSLDTIDEGTTETYNLSVGGIAAVGTITDDDAAPTISSVSAAMQTEGTGLVHTVTLSNASSSATTFAYSLGGGSATGGGVDYSDATFSNGVTLSGGVLTVPAGVTSFTVTVPTSLDTIDEGASETYNLSVGGIAAIGTITDDDNAPTISSVSAATQTEGTSLVHTVTLSNASSSATTFAYSLGGGSATGGGVDYSDATFSNGVTLSGGVLTVPAGVTNFTVTVPTSADTIDEGTSETYNLSVGGIAAIGTITDDDNAPTISSVSAATQTEGTSLVHTVTLSNASSSATTFAYSLDGGSATGGGVDYSDAIFSNGVTLSGGVLTVPAGVTSFTVTVPTSLDTIDEGASETYNLSVGGVEAVGTITDDDNAPTIASVSAATQVEGTSLVHTVTLSNASSSATTFAYSLGGGTATGSGVDYSNATFSNGVTLSGGVLTVPAGVTSFTVTVPTSLDTIDEGASETYNLSVGGVAALGTITDDDNTPTVSSVSSASATEGSDVLHTVTLSNASSVATTYTLSFANGTASSADYTSALTNANFSNGVTISGGTITVPAGVTSFTVSVPTTQDALDEANETYTLTVGGTSGTGTINDDDATPTLSVNDVSVNEAAGTATFTVSLSAASGQTVTVNYATANGTATAGSDYTAASGTLTFAPGVTTQTITVTIGEDTVFEGSEAFNVNLSAPSNATITDATGVGTITDNDAAPVIAGVSSPTAAEGANLVYTVTLSNASSTASSFAYAVGGGSAAAADFGTPTFSNGVTLSGGTLTVPAGVTSFTVTLPTTQDALDEANETVPLSIGGVSGIGTITDDDATPSLSIGDVTVNEAAGTATFTVSLSAASGQTVAVGYSTANGTATTADYTATTGTLTFAPGVTSQTITVSIAEDTIFEGSEAFNVNLATPVNATIADGQGVGTITDNDAAPTVATVSAASATEGANIIHTVTLSNPSASATTYTLTLGGGTATSGGVDYTSALSNASFSNGVTISGSTVTVPAGVTSFTVTVPTTLDTIDEGSSETYSLSVGGVAAVGTITDDDNAPTISSVSAATQVEGTSLVHTVTLSNASSSATTFAYSLDGGTATGGGVDYSSATFSNGVTLSGGVLTVPAGVTSFTVTVPTSLDTIDEGASETYNLSVGGVAAIGTITDDDNAPTISSVSAATQVEGTSLVHTVTLSNASSSATTFAYSLDGGTATGGGVDYSSATFSNGVTLSGGVLTVPAGVTSFTVTVPTSLDTIDEGASETYNLSIGGISTTGTITDDDSAPTISSVSAATQVEGISLVHTVTLSNASSVATTYAYSLGGGTATGGGVDYSNATFSNGVTLSGGVLTVPAGVTSFTVTVPTTLDTIDEGASETYNISVGGVAALGTITDDDNAPIISTVSAATQTEGTSLVHTVTLSNASSSATTFAYSLGGGTATGGGVDYSDATFSNGVTLSGGVLTVPAGVTSFTVTVPTSLDTIDEGTSETYNLSVGGVAAIGTITDDDNAPTISSVSAATQVEGVSLVHTVTLSNASSSATTFAYSLGSGTATGGGVDYSDATFSNGVTLSGGVLTVPAGVTSFTVTVPSTLDTIDEGTSETYNLSVGGVAAVGTITDDDNAPTIASVTSASATEASSILHTVTLSNASSVATTYTLSFANGTASSADYTSALTNANFSNGVTISGGTITVPAGVTSFTVSVPTTADVLDEANETYTLTVGGTSGIGTINDDDATPTLSINDVNVNEAAGTATFTVSLSAASGQTVTVNYGTANSSATAGSDYTATSGTLTFAPGVTAQTITVPITNDTLTEASETFFVNLSGATNATIADTQGQATIIDNDAPPAIDLDANNSTATGTGYTATFTENGSAVAITDTDISITDVDSTTLASATVTLTNAQAGDVLAAGGMPAGITASVSGNVVTLTGTASLAAYQTALRAITFANTSENPSTTARLINVVVNDGTSSSTAATATIQVTALNDAPVATGTALTGTEDTALVFSWANFGVSDVDSATASLGVRVTTLPADGTLQVFNGTTWGTVAAGTLVSKATIDAGSFRFVPDANESGSDAYGGSGVGNRQADYARFNFTPNDGVTDGAAAMMRIDITPAADTPSMSHNASTQVTGTLSTLTSVGLSRDFFDDIATLTSGPSSTNPDVGEAGIETAVPTSSSLITNVGMAGNLSNDTGVQVAADDAFRVQGLIYLQAGSSYVFSGYADDTVRLEIGGSTVLSGQWGVSGQAQSGTFTSSSFTPAVTGYYSLEFMVYNTSGPGSYDLNLSVNGATAVDVSTSNFLLFQSITQVDAAGGQRSAFVPNTTTGEGGYYPVVYDAGVQSHVYLAPVLASLADTDGSESLAVQLQGIPEGATLTDGTNSFTATAAVTSVNITTWNRSSLSITFPSGHAGTSTLTAVATSTETATGATASTSTSFTVTVDVAGANTALSEIGTFNADALIGQAGNDVYTVSQAGTGLAVSVTQGATGSIPAQTGTETTGTTDQAFNTGAGNDYVQAGAGDDTIYLGDTGTSQHPSTGVAPTQANVAAAQMMNLADDATLTDATTGLFTNAADNTTSGNGGNATTSITNWSDVANAGSGNDAVHGQAGTDFLYGGTGVDYLNGGAGIDGLRGGAGNDTLVGGAGNDVLRGDAGADVFRWELADRGTAGTPASDIIMDFNNATPAAGGDVLDLRDLLQSESTSGGAPGNLANYLHFTVNSGTTTIQISSTGAFSGGYNANAVDQSIVLQNVDLTSGGTLSTDQQIIQDLLTKSKLLVDGT
jgi:hypothetical protein